MGENIDEFSGAPRAQLDPLKDIEMEDEVDHQLTDQVYRNLQSEFKKWSRILKFQEQKGEREIILQLEKALRERRQDTAERVIKNDLANAPTFYPSAYHFALTLLAENQLYFRKHKRLELVKVIESAVTEGDFVVNAHYYHRLLWAYTECLDNENSERVLYEMMNQRCQPMQQTWWSLLKMYTLNRDIPSVQKVKKALIEQVEQNPETMNTKTFMALTRSLFDLQQVGDGLSTLDFLRNNGQKLQRKHYDHLLRIVVAYDPPRPDVSRYLFDCLLDDCQTPTASSLDLLVTAIAHTQDPHKMWKEYLEIKEKVPNIEPQVRSRLLFSFTESGHFDHAIQWLYSEVESGPRLENPTMGLYKRDALPEDDRVMRYLHRAIKRAMHFRDRPALDGIGSFIEKRGWYYTHGILAPMMSGYVKLGLYPQALDLYQMAVDTEEPIHGNAHQVAAIAFQKMKDTEGMRKAWDLIKAQHLFHMSSTRSYTKETVEILFTALTATGLWREALNCLIECRNVNMGYAPSLIGKLFNRLVDYKDFQAIRKALEIATAQNLIPVSRTEEVIRKVCSKTEAGRALWQDLESTGMFKSYEQSEAKQTSAETANAMETVAVPRHIHKGYETDLPAVTRFSEKAARIPEAVPMSSEAAAPAQTGGVASKVHPLPDRQECETNGNTKIITGTETTSPAPSASTLESKLPPPATHFVTTQPAAVVDENIKVPDPVVFKVELRRQVSRTKEFQTRDSQKRRTDSLRWFPNFQLYIPPASSSLDSERLMDLNEMMIDQVRRTTLFYHALKPHPLAQAVLNGENISFYPTLRPELYTQPAAVVPSSLHRIHDHFTVTKDADAALIMDFALANMHGIVLHHDGGPQMGSKSMSRTIGGIYKPVASLQASQEKQFTTYLRLLTSAAMRSNETAVKHYWAQLETLQSAEEVLANQKLLFPEMHRRGVEAFSAIGDVQHTTECLKRCVALSHSPISPPGMTALVHGILMRDDRFSPRDMETLIDTMANIDERKLPSDAYEILIKQTINLLALRMENNGSIQMEENGAIGELAVKLAQSNRKGHYWLQPTISRWLRLLEHHPKLDTIGSQMGEYLQPGHLLPPQVNERTVQNNHRRLLAARLRSLNRRGKVEAAQDLFAAYHHMEEEHGTGTGPPGALNRDPEVMATLGATWYIDGYIKKGDEEDKNEVISQLRQVLESYDGIHDGIAGDQASAEKFVSSLLAELFSINSKSEIAKGRPGQSILNDLSVIFGTLCLDGDTANSVWLLKDWTSLFRTIRLAITQPSLSEEHQAVCMTLIRAMVCNRMPGLLDAKVCGFVTTNDTDHSLSRALTRDLTTNTHLVVLASGSLSSEELRMRSDPDNYISGWRVEEALEVYDLCLSLGDLDMAIAIAQRLIYRKRLKGNVISPAQRRAERSIRNRLATLTANIVERHATGVASQPPTLALSPTTAPPASAVLRADDVLDPRQAAGQLFACCDLHRATNRTLSKTITRRMGKLPSQDLVALFTQVRSGLLDLPEGARERPALEWLRVLNLTEVVDSLMQTSMLMVVRGEKSKKVSKHCEPTDIEEEIMLDNSNAIVDELTESDMTTAGAMGTPAPSTYPYDAMGNILWFLYQGLGQRQMHSVLRDLCHAFPLHRSPEAIERFMLNSLKRMEGLRLAERGEPMSVQRDDHYAMTVHKESRWHRKKDSLIGRERARSLIAAEQQRLQELAAVERAEGESKAG
eukprot:Clim_evm146s210 gene=Clim_evmTU146s210